MVQYTNTPQQPYGNCSILMFICIYSIYEFSFILSLGLLTRTSLVYCLCFTVLVLYYEHGTEQFIWF